MRKFLSLSVLSLLICNTWFHSGCVSTTGNLREKGVREPSRIDSLPSSSTHLVSTGSSKTAGDPLKAQVLAQMGVICDAAFSSNLDTLAKKMAVALKLSPQRPLQITTINIDQNYMLSLDPVLIKLKGKLASYVKEVVFNPLKGEENGIILSLIRNPFGYKPISIEDKKIDSLILVGYYDLFTNDSSSVNFHVKIISTNARLIFESEEFTINKDCTGAIRREVFDQIVNSEKFSEMEYRGKIIKQFDDLFNNTQNNNLLAYPAEYRFENKNPYSIQWQVAWMRDLLTRHYGIAVNDTSHNSITIDQSGSVIFLRDGKQYSLAEIVEGEAILPDSFPEEFNIYHSIPSAGIPSNEEKKIESRKITTSNEMAIRDKIYSTFSTYYPQLFNDFNYKKLDEIYIDLGHPSILAGTKLLDNPSTGKEQINYRWRTKNDWLNELQKKIESRNRRFYVQTSVMGLFNDNLDRSRYWAVVKQNWQTKDLTGHTVYQDDGFLLVNFDFAADSSKLRDFKIYYRLWFYNYKYDDVELKIPRHEKLINDIKNYFTDSSTFSGIDSTLKKSMMEFIVDKVRTASTLKTGKTGTAVK